MIYIKTHGSVLHGQEKYVGCAATIVRHLHTAMNSQKSYQIPVPKTTL